MEKAHGTAVKETVDGRPVVKFIITDFKMVGGLEEVLVKVGFDLKGNEATKYISTATDGRAVGEILKKYFNDDGSAK